MIRSPLTIITLVTSVLGVSAGVAACCACPPPEPKNTVILCDRDAGADISIENFEGDRSEEALALKSPCARACKQFSVLGCPESQKLPGGRSCIDTCKAIAPISLFNPECVAAATSVTAVRKCPVVRCDKPDTGSAINTADTADAH